MRVELLYFDDCPSYVALVPRLTALLEEAGAADALELRRVDDEAAAQRERFLGSPTIRVDGEDVEPGAGERHDYGLKCRLYASDQGLQGVPPDTWIEAALARVGPGAG